MTNKSREFQETGARPLTAVVPLAEQETGGDTGRRRPCLQLPESFKHFLCLQ